MDPMSQFEADRKLKEEQEIMELADTVVLDDYYLSSRDLVGKGREVHPTGRQRLDVQNVSEKLRFAQPPNRRKSTGTFSNDKEDDDSAAYFDLNAKPRILITHGPINKLEPGTISLTLITLLYFEEKCLSSAPVLVCQFVVLPIYNCY